MSLATDDILWHGRYRITNLLGRGGMGAVYLAWDAHLEISVALKEMVPQPDLDDALLDELRQQFRREATLLARLDHPNLVRVIDFFEENDNAYLVMNFVEGESLFEKVLRAGALSEAEVLKWTEQLLSALAYCHAKGVIHRDIKPHNVIIRSDGQLGSHGDAVLVDFGLVKLWDPNDPQTKTAMRGMGTPEYAPPEQYDVDMGHTDRRSDIYGLGATLYHILVGKAPPTATLRMAYPERFERAWEDVPQVSERMREVVSIAMELASSKRWSDALEMGTALGLDVSDWDSPAPDDEHFATEVLDQESPLVLEPSAQTAPPVQEDAAAADRQRRMPVWAWIGIAVVVVALGAGGALATGLLGSGSLMPKALPTATATFTPTATAMPTATSTSPPTPTSTSSPTPSPTLMPTSTPVSVTASSLLTATPTLAPTRPTPAPTVVTEEVAQSELTAPTLTFPGQGQTYKSPITFQWQGTLGEGQVYVVRLWHHESGFSLSPPAVSGQALSVDLPAERYGEWRWTVSVLQGDSVLATSEEGMFWFDPSLGQRGDSATPPPSQTSPLRTPPPPP